MNIFKIFEEEDCPICFEKISKNKIYVMIDSEGENAKYHVRCIEKWLNKSTNGILTQNQIEKINLNINNETFSQLKLIIPDHDDDYDACCIIL